MEIRHLQSLLGIADFGTFSSAAQALGTVQSNISAQVARLESELHATLVDRTTGRLTDEGEIVAARARRVMMELDAMITDVGALRHNVVGTLRMGIISTTGQWLIPLVMELLQERHPHVRLIVVEGSNSTLGPQLLTGKLDVAVMSLPLNESEVTIEPIFQESLNLVLPRDHRLSRDYADHDVVPAEKLADLDLFLPLPGTALRGEIDRAVSRANVKLRPVLELDGVRLLASLTFEERGVAILPASAFPRYVRDKFRILAIDGFPMRKVGIATRRLALPSALSRALIDVVQDVVNEPSNLPEGIIGPLRTSVSTR